MIPPETLPAALTQPRELHKVACHFQIAQTAQNVEIKVLVGGKDEQVVGGQTLTVSAAEPSRTPQTFKVLWGAGQPEPVRWVPSIFPGDPWELVFKILDESGRALECAAPQIKVSLRPYRTGAATPALQVRAVPPSSVDLEEAKRRRTSYSTLPTSFILSLVQPLPAGVRGMYLLEAEVTHGDMEIQLRMQEIGFDLQPSRVPIEWSPEDVVNFLRSQRLPIDPAADAIRNHEGLPVDGRLLVQDGQELLLTWIGTFDPATRAAVKAALQLVADLQSRAASLGATHFQGPPRHQQLQPHQMIGTWPPPP